MSFLSNIFGGGKTPQVQFQPQGFNAGGINSSYGPGGYNITPTQARTDATSGLSGAYGNLGTQYGNLLSTVQPGFNDLLNSRLADVNDRATAAIGNLKQNLQSRRILGSSFGNDTLTRADLEWQKQRDAVISDNYLKSLAASSELLGKQYDAWTKQYSSVLDELNLEAGLGNQLTTNANTVLSANARLNAELEAKAQQGQGQFFGGILGRLAGPALSGIGNMILPGIGGILGGMAGGLLSGGGSQPSYGLSSSGTGGLW